MIPCKDCILFAICKAQVQGSNPYGNVVTKLLPKCSIIKEYTKSKGSSTFPNYSPIGVDLVGYFFSHGKEYVDGPMH